MRNNCNLTFSPFTPPVPTQFEEALSYEQQIEILYRKVAEALNWMKEHKNEVMNAVMTEMLRRLKKELTEFDKEYQGKFQELDAKILVVASNLEKLVKEVNENYVILDAKIDSAIEFIGSESNALYARILLEESARKQADKAIRNEMHNISDNIVKQIDAISDALTVVQNSMHVLSSEFISFKNFILERFGQLENDLINYIDEHISVVNGDRILVTNPTTTKTDTLKNTLSDIWNYKFPYGITCREWNLLNLICREFDSLLLTCWQFNNKAALIFNHWVEDAEYLKRVNDLEKRVSDIEDTKWWSQLLKGQVSPYDAYSELVNFVKTLHNIGFTCVQFDAQTYTCTIFNDLDINCKEFNMRT